MGGFCVRIRLFDSLKVPVIRSWALFDLFIVPMIQSWGFDHLLEVPMIRSWGFFGLFKVLMIRSWGFFGLLKVPMIRSWGFFDLVKARANARDDWTVWRICLEDTITRVPSSSLSGDLHAIHCPIIPNRVLKRRFSRNSPSDLTWKVSCWSW